MKVDQVDTAKVIRNAHRLCRTHLMWRDIPLWQFVGTLCFDHVVAAKTRVPVAANPRAGTAPAPTANEAAARALCKSLGWDPDALASRDLPSS